MVKNSLESNNADNEKSVADIERLNMQIKELKNSIELLQASQKSLLEKTFNSAYYTGSENYVKKCQEFASLFYGDELLGIEAPNDFESFLFFTDPHLVSGKGWEEKCYEYIAQIQKYYNSTPTTFCLCAGDWIGAYDLPYEACFKLGFINGFMNSMFKNCYMLLGNHDSNYQGKKDPEVDAWTTKLSNQANINLWYRKEKKTYFSFEGANTVFYCFDTGAEREPLTARNGLGFEQALWFAESLSREEHKHIAIALHMLFPFPKEADVQPLSQMLLDIAQAYNNRSAIEVNGKQFDYSKAIGRVEFLIAGHSHRDADFVINGIPCIECVHTLASLEEATFDLVFADYNKRVLQFVRVGYGENRTILL